MVKIGVVTVSDRASRGEYEDLGGPAIVDFLTRHIANEWEAVRRIVPDEVDTIAAALRELADDEGCSLIVTTGGKQRGVGQTSGRTTLPKYSSG